MVVALVAIVVGGAAVSIASILKSTDISNAQTIALRQVQNVGFWITRDVVMAKPGTIHNNPDGVFLSLKFDEWDEDTKTFVERTIEYVFDGDKLKRRVTNGTTSEILIAEYIVEVGTTTKIVADGTNKYKLTVKASCKEAFAGASVERTYKISPRLGS